MTDLGSIFLLAMGLVTSGNPELYGIIWLSLRVSLTAVAIGCLIGLPLGAALAVVKFPGRGAVIAVLNAFMGLPPVVVGLVVYLMLSRSGPLGVLGLLYTPTAMIIAQALLVTPLIAALARQSLADLHLEYDELFRSLRLSTSDKIAALIKRISAKHTILMVEHNLSVVSNLSDIITVLTRGRVLAEGDYATLSKDERVKEAYLGAGS